MPSSTAIPTVKLQPSCALRRGRCPCQTLGFWWICVARGLITPFGTGSGMVAYPSYRFGPVGMAPAKSRYAPSGQTVATGQGLYIRRVRSEYSFPFVFSPRVISPRRPWNRTESWGDTDLGEVAETAPPTSDGSEGKSVPAPRHGLFASASSSSWPVPPSESISVPAPRHGLCPRPSRCQCQLLVVASAHWTLSLPCPSRCQRQLLVVASASSSSWPLPAVLHLVIASASRAAPSHCQCQPCSS